jgi:hypothetical protein
VLQTAGVSTVGLVVCVMVLQHIIELHAMAPGYKRTAKLPTIGRATMLAHNLVGWVC